MFEEIWYRLCLWRMRRNLMKQVRILEEAARISEYAHPEMEIYARQARRLCEAPLREMGDLDIGMMLQLTGKGSRIAQQMRRRPSRSS